MFTYKDMMIQRQNSRDFDKAVNGLNAEIEELAEALLAEKAASLELLQALRVERAHSAGLLAQVTAMVAAHPDSALLALTGNLKSNGKPEKVLGRDYYNVAFDAKALEMGLKTPTDFRV
jgi:hypothetical protein